MRAGDSLIARTLFKLAESSFEDGAKLGVAGEDEGEGLLLRVDACSRRPAQFLMVAVLIQSELRATLVPANKPE